MTIAKTMIDTKEIDFDGLDTIAGERSSTNRFNTSLTGVKKQVEIQLTERTMKRDLPEGTNSRRILHQNYCLQFQMNRVQRLQIILQNAIAVHGRQLDILKNRAEEIDRANRVQEDLLQERLLKKSELDTIQGMGFGLSEMKRLHYLIDEIAKEADLPTEQNAAVIKFFRDLEEHYDDYLNLGKKIDEGRAKLRKIAEAQDFLSITPNITPEIVKMIQILVSAGIKKADLEHLTRMIIQNRLPQTKNSSDENIPQMENHPKSDYSYSKTEVQGVKTVTEESTTLSGSQSDLRRGGSTKAADVVAKSDADAGILADGMNLQQIMAQIHGTDTSHKDDEVFIPPNPRVGAVDQANNQRVLKRIRPPPPVGTLMGVRKKKSRFVTS